MGGEPGGPIDTVDQGIIDKGFLGQPAPVPGRG